jgi:hypothetical protein
VTRRRLLLALVALLALLAPPAAALAVQQRGESQVVTLSLGDIARVAGARVGCVARLEGGSRVLDCRRIGMLRGTYGTILSGSKAMVVRFSADDTAHVVFVAHHGSTRTRTCKATH